MTIQAKEKTARRARRAPPQILHYCSTLPSPLLRRLEPWLPAAAMVGGTIGLLHMIGGPQGGVMDTLRRLIQEEPLILAVFVLFWLLGAYVSWLYYRLRTRARMIVTHDKLTFRSAMPFLEKWLDFSLDLEAIRTGEIHLIWTQLFDEEHGPRTSYRLRPSNRLFARIAPAQWVPEGMTEPAWQRLTPQSTILGERNDADRDTLRNNYMQLPLIQALLAQGVPLDTPPVTLEELKQPSRGASGALHRFLSSPGAIILFGLISLAFLAKSWWG